MSQLYRCTLKTAMGGLIAKDVLAETGDAAADKALAEYPGAFVTHIEPAPASAQPHLDGQVNDGALTASQAKAAGEEALLKVMAA